MSWSDLSVEKLIQVYSENSATFYYYLLFIPEIWYQKTGTKIWYRFLVFWYRFLDSVSRA